MLSLRLRPIALLSICLLMAVAMTGCSLNTRVAPAALMPGDTIAIVAPASPAEQDRVALATKRLEKMGYHVKTQDDLYRTRGYLGGSDRARAAELMAAFEDSEVDAIFPGRGGYGVTRILDRLDFDVIRENPKILIGYSDITALHIAIGQETGLITFHSPLAMYGLGSPEGLDPLSDKYFWRSICGKSANGEADAREVGYSFDVSGVEPAVETVVGGVGMGRLTGGNLSLIVALMGTPYEMDTRGAVLFIEDIDEQPYRIDRYLSQLKLAGKLDEPVAIILGQFTNCGPKPGKPSLTLDEVLSDYFADLKIPVIRDFPSGHDHPNVTLPIGALVEVNADNRTVRVLEEPVR